METYSAISTARSRNMVSKQLKLLVAAVVLFPELLVLLFKLPELIGHPLLDPGGLCFHLLRVLES